MDRLGIIGHCMGGRMALLGASTHDVFKACVPYYPGNMFKAWSDDGPPPFELLGQIKGSVLGFFGNDDQKAVISESMVVAQLSKEYLSDMCCIVDSSMVVMFNFISKVLTFEFSGFQDYIADLKEDDRFTNARLNYCTKWLSAYLATD